MAFALAWVDDDAGLRNWWRLRGELAEARGRIAAVESRVAVREAEAERLRDDPLALERAIREDLRLAKPGETLLIVRPEGEPNPRNP